MSRCNSGKRVFQTHEDAVAALLGARTKFDYRQGHGPVSVYHCDECGFYHLTSKGPMDETLKKGLSDGSIDRKKEADDWEARLKRK
jgi:hypothetical protein